MLLTVLALGGCDARSVDASPRASACDTVIEIEGEYQCGGECVVTSDDWSKRVVTVSGETDTIQRFPGASGELYRTTITGANSFHEVEIGALTGLVLRAATAKVSDGQFPVLEEYVFETGPTCTALGYTKIVRNPSPENFKSCAIRCQKSG